jgi:hypothetical protein
MEAMDPNDLRALFTDAIFGDAIQPGGFWDTPTYEEVLAREARERTALARLADDWRDEWLEQ